MISWSIRVSRFNNCMVLSRHFLKGGVRLSNHQLLARDWRRSTKKRHRTSDPCVNSNTFRMNPTQADRRAHGRSTCRSISKQQKERRAGATTNPAATTRTKMTKQEHIIIDIIIYYSWSIDEFCHYCCWLPVLASYISINVGHCLLLPLIARYIPVLVDC